MPKQRSKITGGLILGLALLCLSGLLWQQLRPALPLPQSTIVLNLNGQEERFPLSQNMTKEIKTACGYNKICVQDGTVQVTEADCRDNICVKTGKIKKAGEAIACLPHKLLIYIEEK